jgi:hypothetical protein
MILDNLPVTTNDLRVVRSKHRFAFGPACTLPLLLPPTRSFFTAQEPQQVRPGFELGYTANNKYYIYNHLVLNVLIHQVSGDFLRAKQAR